MEKLDKNARVFLADLINCILDDINVTLLFTDDPEYLELLDFLQVKLRSAFIRLNKYNIRRNENE